MSLKSQEPVSAQGPFYPLNGPVMLGDLGIHFVPPHPPRPLPITQVLHLV